MRDHPSVALSDSPGQARARRIGVRESNTPNRLHVDGEQIILEEQLERKVQYRI